MSDRRYITSTFLFAWYTAIANIDVTATETQVATAKTASIAALEVDAVWDGTGVEDGTTHLHAIKPVELTRYSDGKTFVWTGSTVVEAQNQNTYVKSEKIVLSFATDNASKSNYAGDYPVTISASGHLRISKTFEDSGSDDDTWQANDYVGYYYHTNEAIDPTQENIGTNKATADQVIQLGFLRVSDQGAFSYYGITGDGEIDTSNQFSGGFTIYVSISPEHDDRGETSDTGGTNYGTITPVIGAYGEDFAA